MDGTETADRRDERFEEAADVAERFLDNVEQAVHGKRREVQLVLAALTCHGHVLLEDVPGTAKTVLARAIAQTIEGATPSRIRPPYRRALPSPTYSCVLPTIPTCSASTTATRARCWNAKA